MPSVSLLHTHGPRSHPPVVLADHPAALSLRGHPPPWPSCFAGTARRLLTGLLGRGCHGTSGGESILQILSGIGGAFRPVAEVHPVFAWQALKGDAECAQLGGGHLESQGRFTHGDAPSPGVG